MKTLLLSVALVAMIFAAPVFAASTNKGSLDGKSFTVQVKMPDGKTADSTFTFKDGKVESSLATAAGYKPAEYTATSTPLHITTVTAELKDDKGDVQKIHGTVNENKWAGSIEEKQGSNVSKLTFGPKPSTVAAAPKPAAPSSLLPITK